MDIIRSVDMIVMWLLPAAGGRVIVMGEATHFAVVVDAELDEETRNRIDRRLREVVAEELADLEFLDIPVRGEDGGPEIAPPISFDRLPATMGIIAAPGSKIPHWINRRGQ